MRGSRCEICSGERELVVHHIDADDTNDDLDNLLLVCRTCHGRVHSPNEHGEQWDRLTRELPDSSLFPVSGPGKVTSVRIDQEHHQWCKIHNINVSKLVRVAIDERMGRSQQTEEPKPT